MSARSFLMSVLLLLSVSAYAQGIRTVSGEYTYYPPDTESYELSKIKALQRAKEQILADVFGTVINSESTTVVSASQDKSAVNTFSVGNSVVKGEWLETVGEPIFSRFLDRNDMMAIKVKVTGRVREIVISTVDFDARILRNGVDDRFESTDFISGDDLFVSFRTPVDGYLVIYLYDGKDTAYCLLPYLSMSQGAFNVKGGERYVLFSSGEAVPPVKPTDVDEFTVTSEQPVEFNRIYCIYSPDEFAKALDVKSDLASLPRGVGFRDFQKWLVGIRIRDNRIVVKTFDITIKQER
ncbi:MAG: DUF4384 domain-containing protein [Bacteroidia bacterium]|nr:DUF4384 domain-containing protein [Bacteroidia bacterium]